MASSTTRKDQIRAAALADLKSFINLVHPGRVLGQAHHELLRWWNKEDALSHQLVLLPRDHQKSALLAYRVAWEITKNPSIRVLYVSSTANLATKQLKFIKDILTCDIYRFYWPDMVNIEESKREKWTETEISVDHPARKAEHVRDPTVFTAGLTTNIVGMHCDISALDDVVVDDTAYSEDGREKVRNQVSYLASIAGTDSRQWAVGTRYHPLDLYNDLQSQRIELYNNDGELASDELLYETYQREVETNGDGTGQFLWPKQQRGDGRWFGFDQRVLAVKKAQYADRTKFRAQYYNDPNDAETSPIKRDDIQYWSPNQLIRDKGSWHYADSRLNVFAAVDFAFSLSNRADYTAIVVVGVDRRQNYYILDIARFRTNKIGEYFQEILKMYSKWDFRKLRAEVSVAQAVIVKDLKENYIRPNGLAFSVDEYRPSRAEGTKEERINSTLQAKYQNHQVFHRIGGNWEILEEELVKQNPAHDDVKDALAACIDICIAPSHYNKGRVNLNQQMFHQRFGGVSC